MTQHLNPSLAGYSPEEPVRPELAEEMAQAAAKAERELCKRDACMYCAGRTPYTRVPVGPNTAGNFEHMPPPPLIIDLREPVRKPVLCAASAIFARERFDQNRRDAIEGRQIEMKGLDEIVGLQEPLSIQQILACFPPEAVAPLPMILWCPACGFQHIDKPQPEKQWENPPHRSHECQGCGFVWRQADIPTTGVQQIATSGKNDSPMPIFSPPSRWFMPWTSPPLNDWSICGMNHYYLTNNRAAGRHLFVAMTRAGRVIQAEGASEVAVFLLLKDRAAKMNEIITGENK